MALTNELKELYASGGDDVILHTLAFSHPTWDADFYIVRDWQDFTANLEDSGPSTLFQKFAFSISGPDKDVIGNQTLSIQVDAVSRELVALLETANTDTNNNPIKVTYRIYLASDTSGPQNDPPLKMFMRTVRVNNTQITGQAELVNLENRKFPNVLYDNTFQSLVNAT